MELPSTQLSGIKKPVPKAPPVLIDLRWFVNFRLCMLVCCLGWNIAHITAAACERCSGAFPELPGALDPDIPFLATYALNMLAILLLQYTMVANARALNPKSWQEPVSAVLFCFVPLVNMVVPFAQFAYAYRDIAKAKGKNPKRGLWLVGLCWLFFLIDCGVILENLTPYGDFMLRLSQTGFICASAVFIAACVFPILLCLNLRKTVV